MTVNAVQEAAGEYFVTWAEENGYGKLLRALGHNIVEFLINLNSLWVLQSCCLKPMLSAPLLADQSASLPPVRPA